MFCVQGRPCNGKGHQGDGGDGVAWDTSPRRAEAGWGEGPGRFTRRRRPGSERGGDDACSPSPHPGRDVRAKLGDRRGGGRWIRRQQALFVGKDGAGRVQAGCGAASSPALGPPQLPRHLVVGSATARVQRRVWECPPYKLSENATWAMARRKQRTRTKARQNMSQRGTSKKHRCRYRPQQANRPPRRCPLTRHAASAWPPGPGAGGSAWPLGPSAGPAGTRPRQTGCPGQRPSCPRKRRS